MTMSPSVTKPITISQLLLHTIGDKSSSSAFRFRTDQYPFTLGPQFQLHNSLYQQLLGGYALNGADGEDVGTAGEDSDVHRSSHALGGQRPSPTCRWRSCRLPGGREPPIHGVVRPRSTSAWPTASPPPPSAAPSPPHMVSQTACPVSGRCQVRKHPSIVDLVYCTMEMCRILSNSYNITNALLFMSYPYTTYMALEYTKA